MEQVKLYKKAPKALQLIALSGVFTAIGIWMIIRQPSGSGNYIMAWGCTCFFGLGVLLGLYHLLDKRPQIIITEDGILDRANRRGEISWEQIEEASTRSISGQHFVILILSETFEEVYLSLSQVQIDKQMLNSFILEMISSDKLRRKELIRKCFHEGTAA